MLEFNNVRNVLNDFGKFLVEEYQDNLILEDAIASKTLYNSLQYKVENGNNLQFK